MGAGEYDPNLSFPRSHWPGQWEPSVCVLEAAFVSASEGNLAFLYPLLAERPLPRRLTGAKRKHSGRDLLAESCCWVRQGQSVSLLGAGLAEAVKGGGGGFNVEK